MPLHRQPLQNVLLIVSAHLGRNRQRPLLDPVQMLSSVSRSAVLFLAPGIAWKRERMYP